jgi:hypothetical protein
MFNRKTLAEFVQRYSATLIELVTLVKTTKEEKTMEGIKT